MKYQDELEAGKRSRKEGMTIAQQLEHYRKKLLSKVSMFLQEKSSVLLWITFNVVDYVSGINVLYLAYYMHDIILCVGRRKGT